MANVLEGYKVLNPDWTGRGGFQFEVGKTYEEDVIPYCESKGFHFCTELNDCFTYYPFNYNNKVAKIIAFGEIDEYENANYVKLYSTNKIKIVEEISWEEVLRMLNTGKNNSGRCNTGDYNSGDYNTGNRNSDKCNCGDYNSGGYNVGNYNFGDGNTGYYNTGAFNSGNFNKGNFNTGDWNDGNYNVGIYNYGNYNTGDWNKTHYCNGSFNTIRPKTFYLFNKPSEWTFRDWLNSDARKILIDIPRKVTEWISSDDMTDEEKEEYPDYEVIGGYLKVLDDESESVQSWWDSLSETDKNTVKAIPNFDEKLFEFITGIKI